MKRVVVTGAGAVCALGNDWAAVRARLQEGRSAVVRMPDWASFRGLNTQLAAPVPDFELPEHYTRKRTRAMGRVALMSVLAAEAALRRRARRRPAARQRPAGYRLWFLDRHAGGRGGLRPHADRALDRGHHGHHLYPHDAAHHGGQHGVFFGITGRIITTSSACTSGSRASAMPTRRSAPGAGGYAGRRAEELDPTEAAVFDTLFATSTRNDAPHTTPRPFDGARATGWCWARAPARCCWKSSNTRRRAARASWPRSSASAPTATAPT